MHIALISRRSTLVARAIIFAILTLLGLAATLPQFGGRNIASASVGSPSINFCPSGVQTFGPVQTHASGAKWVSQITMPAGGGAMGIYFDPAGTTTVFPYPVFDVGGPRTNPLVGSLSGGGTATFNDSGYSGTFSTDFIGCTTLSNITGTGSFTMNLNFVRNSVNYSVPITITVAAPLPPLQTVTYLGGVLPAGQPIGTLDTTTDFTLNGGATWQPAYLVGGGHPWGIVSGTNSWINCGPSLNSCLNQTVDYRVRFVVPAGFSNPQIAFSIIADNAGTLFLNGTQISPRFGSGGNLPPVSVGSSLVTGINTLIIRVEDWGGLAGFNYKAILTMNAPAPVVTIPPAPADTTPPVITHTITGTLGNNGWYVSNAALAWTVTDPQTAFTTSGCGPQNVNSDTAGATFTCSATSEGGSASASVTIKRDSTAPAISGSASPAANANGWNNSDVTVSFACSDGGSGVASCTAPVTVSAEGTTTVNGTVTDAAGNSASTSVMVKVDKTAPAVSITGPAIIIQGQPASDALSGLAITPSGALALDTSTQGAHTATVTATDKAGNSASATLTYMVWTLNCEAPPIFKNGAGTGQFNAGSTIPVKCSITVGANVITTATGSASIGTASAPLRYDPTDQRYIATVKTVKTSTGSFAVIVTIDGVGSVQVATVTTR